MLQGYISAQTSMGLRLYDSSLIVLSSLMDWLFSVHWYWLFSVHWHVIALSSLTYDCSQFTDMWCTQFSDGLIFLSSLIFDCSQFTDMWCSQFSDGLIFLSSLIFDCPLGVIGGKLWSSRVCVGWLIPFIFSVCLHSIHLLSPSFHNYSLSFPAGAGLVKRWAISPSIHPFIIHFFTNSVVILLLCKKAIQVFMVSLIVLNGVLFNIIIFIIQHKAINRSFNGCHVPSLYYINQWVLSTAEHNISSIINY